MNEGTKAEDEEDRINSPLLSDPATSAQAWNRNSRRPSSVHESILESGSRHSPGPLLYANRKGPPNGQATGGVSTAHVVAGITIPDKILQLLSAAVVVICSNAVTNNDQDVRRNGMEGTGERK